MRVGYLKLINALVWYVSLKTHSYNEPIKMCFWQFAIDISILFVNWLFDTEFKDPKVSMCPPLKTEFENLMIQSLYTNPLHFCKVLFIFIYLPQKPICFILQKKIVNVWQKAMGFFSRKTGFFPLSRLAPLLETHLSSEQQGADFFSLFYNWPAALLAGDSGTRLPRGAVLKFYYNLEIRFKYPQRRRLEII